MYDVIMQDDAAAFVILLMVHVLQLLICTYSDLEARREVKYNEVCMHRYINICI